MKQKEDAKGRLMRAAIMVFARDGYHKASTRNIAREADVNIAAIQYYFGGKAELYREIFNDAFQSMLVLSAPMEHAGLPLADALAVFFRSMMPDVAASPDAEKICRLIAREETDPSGVIGDWKSTQFSRQYARLMTLLQSHLALEKPDDDLHRLAFSLVGAASIFVDGRYIVVDFAPELLSDDDAIDATLARLVEFALCMIAAEHSRRAKREGCP